MTLNYAVMCGAWGRYGYIVPVSRERAARLVNRYAVDRARDSYGFSFDLSACPSEVRYALDHGARPEFRVLVTR
jgi:hypothetical protein